MRTGAVRRLPWVIAAALLVGSAGGTAFVAILGSREPVREERPELSLVLPLAPDELRSAAPGDLEAPSSRAAAGGPPLLLDAALLEPTAHGGVPRIAADGRRVSELHRRRSQPSGRARAGIVLVGIGLDRSAAASAVQLPGVVTLAVSPYAEDAPRWFRVARWRGHETLMELPVRPVGYPLDDAGPLAIAAVPADLDRLERVLARGTGYLGLAVRAGVLADRPVDALPIASVLASRGVALVELGTRALEQAARAAGLPYLPADGPIDVEPTGPAIDAALADLEARARASGSALAYGRPLPITIDRIARWSASLADRDVELVGVGALLDAPR